MFTLDQQTIQAIQQIGLPSVIVLGLLWFLYKVWNYVTSKLDDKDKFIKEQLDRGHEHRERMVKTQETIGETLAEIKNIVITKL